VDFLGIVGIDVRTGEVTELLDHGANPTYLPSGHLVYTRPGGLMAVAFDAAALRVTGSPTPVIDGARTGGFGVGHYAVSNEGTLVYVSGTSVTETELVWVEPDGAVKPAGFPVDSYEAFRISPDGERLVIAIDRDRHDVWVFDIRRGTQRRLTSEGSNHWPVWSHDGEWVVFSSIQDESRELRRAFVDGSGRVDVLPVGEGALWPYDVSPDGRFLAYAKKVPGLEGEIDTWLLDLESGETRPFLELRGRETLASFSPDGRWLSYFMGGDRRGLCRALPFWGFRRSGLARGRGGG